MKFPTDPEGYLISDDGSVHTRYATHAKGQRTRTTKGATTLLQGKRGKLCKDCYGNNPPTPDDTPRPPQQRRVPSAPALPRR